MTNQTSSKLSKATLEEGRHYYFENGYMVFTKEYHLQGVIVVEMVAGIVHTIQTKIKRLLTW